MNLVLVPGPRLCGIPTEDNPRNEGRNILINFYPSSSYIPEAEIVIMDFVTMRFGFCEDQPTMVYVSENSTALILARMMIQAVHLNEVAGFNCV
jgi:hypothetical protein